MVKTKNIFFLIFLTVINPIFGWSQLTEPQKPNVIIFIADDISWNDFGCYGNKEVQTPNIDRIASRGLKFTNFYLTTSSCSPSRISIMTGRYPHNTGAAELHTEPTVDFATIGSVLKENGYHTAQAGKWHMGKKIKSGFDTIIEKHSENGDGGEEQWVDVLQNREKGKPFFFWYAAYDAHRIWGENEFSATHTEKNVVPPPTLINGEETRKDLAKYYDEIKRFDHYIGKVEKELELQGVLENTVIIIMADNGRPFPRDKTRLYDSGIKTPFIVSWPASISTKGAVCSSLVSAVDIAPTVVALSQSEQPISFQGKNFEDLLKNPNDKFRNFVFAEHNWHDYEAYERMVRNSNFMYIVNSRPQLANQGPLDAVRSPSFAELVEHRDANKLTQPQKDIFMAPRPGEELFDCKTDSLQTNNLIGNPKYKTIHDELKKTLKKWKSKTKDNIPAVLTKDWYSRTGEKSDQKDFKIRGEMPGKSSNAEALNVKDVF
ncbi:sulfatase [Reichenbachiella sp. MALMAid0571]|uniref:sulfatase family protein n=1 Tax=Reichenbachiella sp. MALMAid0571 TaxID=3143939 RepID=UPI0032DFF37E